MIISRSESRNSRTRFRLVLDENTSKSCRRKRDLSDFEQDNVCKAYLDDILVFQLAQKLDLTNSRHVETILELPDFDLFNGHFTASLCISP